MAGQYSMPVERSPRDTWKRRIAWLLIALDVVLVVAVIVSFIVFRISSSTPTPSSSSLQTLANVPLAGGLPRFDQQSLDPNTKLLFIAHSGANNVIVFDTSTKKVVTQIPGISHAHGVLVIPELKRVYVSDSLDNLVFGIDETNFHIVTKIAVGQKPDMIAYDQVDHKLFVSNELGQSDTVIDTQTEQAVGTIPLAGQAGNTRYDGVAHRILVAVQTLNQVVAIDPVANRITAHYTLPSACKHDHGLILDTSQRLAFIACDMSATLLMMDLNSMKVVSTQSVGADPDLMAFDNGRHLLYVATHSGVLSAFIDQGRTLQKMYQQCVATNAHSIAVNDATHEIYMPLVSSPSDTCAPVPVGATPTVKGQAVLRIGLFNFPAAPA
jgi:DNA-binding beta-propeller fold protein YncE